LVVEGVVEVVEPVRWAVEAKVVIDPLPSNAGCAGRQVSIIMGGFALLLVCGSTRDRLTARHFGLGLLVSVVKKNILFLAW
jgi:hypothetical protein